MTTYPIDLDDELWNRIKDTVSHAQVLNDEIVRRLELASFAEKYERKADGRGRISLPSEYAENEVTVLVIDSSEIDTEQSDEGS